MAHSPSCEEVPAGKQQTLGDTSQCFGPHAFFHDAVKKDVEIHKAAHHPSFRTSHSHVL